VKEVERLEQLTSAINEADTDQDQPICENALGSLDKEVFGHESPGTEHEQARLCSSQLSALQQRLASVSLSARACIPFDAHDSP
jgi:hypothetical protein